jgi:hypothetical protein
MQELGASPIAQYELLRARPLWKTLLVGAVIAYSPLLLVFVVLVLFFGASSPNESARSLLTGLSVVSGIAAAFMYIVAAGVAVIYVDRRREPVTFSFWGSVGSVFLLYLAILLPFIVVFGIVLMLSAGGSR